MKVRKRPKGEKVWENRHLLIWTGGIPMAVFGRIRSFNQQSKRTVTAFHSLLPIAALREPQHSLFTSITCYKELNSPQIKIMYEDNFMTELSKISGIWNKVIFKIFKNPYISNSETLLFQKEWWVIFLDLEEVCRFDSRQACSQWADFRTKSKHFSSSHYFFCYL